MTPIQSDSQIIFCKNTEALADEAVQKVLALTRRTIQDRGIFRMGISSGFTCRTLYSWMASAKYRNEFDWENIHIFWLDERWVPVTDPKSNYGMVAEALLTRIDIPIENMHPIKTNTDDPKASAMFYEQELQIHFGIGEGEIPRFDLILLGLGRDGHIASLFPHHETLGDKKRLAVPVASPDLEEKRVSVSLPVINQAENILFLVTGREKAEIVKRVLTETPEQSDLPACRVQPARGSVSWMVDQQAASLLDKH